MRSLQHCNVAVISFCADLLVICSGSCVTPRVLHPSELRYGVSAKKWKVRQCFMGIVEQFLLEGLEVVMPARRYQLTAITTAPASRLRSAVGYGRCGTFPYSLYVSPRTVALLRSF